MDGVKIGKVGQSEIFKFDEERKDQDEEKLCKSIITSRSSNASQDAIVRNTRYWQRLKKKTTIVRDTIDDITDKELPRHEVRQTREQELKDLCDLGVYEKVEEREAIAQYQITPVDTKWIDTNKAFEVELMQIILRLVAKEKSKVKIGQICTQGLLHWKR